MIIFRQHLAATTVCFIVCMVKLAIETAGCCVFLTSSSISKCDIVSAASLMAKVLLPARLGTGVNERKWKVEVAIFVCEHLTWQKDEDIFNAVQRP